MAKAIVNRQENTIDFDTFDNIKGYTFSFDRELDTLYWLSMPVQAATSIDRDGVWYRVTPQTGKITGIEIEDFESVFLKKHPELEPSWKQVRKTVIKDKADASTITFGNILFAFLQNGIGSRHKLEHS
jgi:hypothetical protein